jgi:hypothetical protein
VASTSATLPRATPVSAVRTSRDHTVERACVDGSLLALRSANGRSSGPRLASARPGFGLARRSMAVTRYRNGIFIPAGIPLEQIYSVAAAFRTILIAAARPSRPGLTVIRMNAERTQTPSPPPPKDCLVYRCTLPWLGQEELLYVRVVRARAPLHLDIRIVAKSGEVTSVTVKRSDVEFAVTSGILEVVTEISCADCGSVMRLWNAVVRQRPTVLFACRDCEAVVEL